MQVSIPDTMKHMKAGIAKSYCLLGPAHFGDPYLRSEVQVLAVETFSRWFQTESFLGEKLLWAKVCLLRGHLGAYWSVCDTKVETELLPSLPFWSPELVLDSLAEIMNQTAACTQLPPVNPPLGQRARLPLHTGLVVFCRKWVGSSDWERWWIQSGNVEG